MHDVILSLFHGHFFVTLLKEFMVGVYGGLRMMCTHLLSHFMQIKILRALDMDHGRNSLFNITHEVQA